MKEENPSFDYSKIRPEGVPLKTFGGLSSGSKPLEDLHDGIRMVLDKNDGKDITVTSIVDIMNLVGKCVVSGNVRRTAEIAFGEHDSQEFMDLKNYEVNPQRMEWDGLPITVFLPILVWTTPKFPRGFAITVSPDWPGLTICKTTAE